MTWTLTTAWSFVKLLNMDDQHHIADSLIVLRPLIRIYNERTGKHYMKREDVMRMIDARLAYAYGVSNGQWNTVVLRSLGRII